MVKSSISIKTARFGINNSLSVCNVNKFVAQISKQKVDCVDLTSLGNDTQSGNNDDSLVENEYVTKFPRCLLIINGKLSITSSRLKVNGLCGVAKESSEFNLAFPTESGYRFELYDHIDPHIIITSKTKLSVI